MPDKFQIVTGDDVEDETTSLASAMTRAKERAMGLTAYSGLGETVCIRQNGKEVGRFIGTIGAKWIKAHKRAGEDM